MRSIRVILRLSALAALATVAAMTTSCEESVTPVVAERIEIVSGNNQLSRHGTELENPLTVRIRFANGDAADGETVQFRTINGGGSAVTVNVVASLGGFASTRYVLGDMNGPNVMRAVIQANDTKAVTFTATAGDFFCAEEVPTFVRRFTPAHNIFLSTRSSQIHTDAGGTTSGILKLIPNGPQGLVGVTSFKRIEEDQTDANIRDIAFSHAGEFFIALTADDDDIWKMNPDGSCDFFASLEAFFGIAEITTHPTAILAGCDCTGPFLVGCRSPFIRFPDEGAVYSGDPGDDCNDESVAVDPNTEDIYYIYLGANTIKRLPVDSRSATGNVETVVELTADQAKNACGMVSHTDGTIFFLVDSNNTKAIFRVDPVTDELTMVFDFTDPANRTNPGVQSDLAIDSQFSVLYTLDTEANVLLQLEFNRVPVLLTELVPNTGSGPESLSSNNSSGEPVGLAVWP